MWANKYKIDRPLIETEITRTVTDKYLFDGNLKPVKKNMPTLSSKEKWLSSEKTLLDIQPMMR